MSAAQSATGSSHEARAMMDPYWIVAEQRLPPHHRRGVGITARSESDARAIFEFGFSAYRLVGIEVIKDMRQLDQNHVVPNMGNSFERGVWYPRAYLKIPD